MTAPMIGLEDPAYAGQRHYTPAFLRLYDPLVLGIFGRYVWRCPTDRLIHHYARHMGRRHLDVGPGTGYFLHRVRQAGDGPITLVDPNPSVLAHATRRLSQLDVKTIQSDVCKPLPTERRFDSAALNYVLHCLPGPMARKAAAVRHVAAVLTPEGVLFGATVLGTPALHTAVSRRALKVNNRRGIFDNLADTEAGLHRTLGRSFRTVTIDVIGSVALFTATHPHGPATGSRPRDGRRPRWGSGRDDWEES